MSQTIEIIISPAGQATIQTKGFAGASCQDASRFIEQALGKKLDESLTAEFFQQQVSLETRQELK
jgi:hypothetical protein